MSINALNATSDFNQWLHAMKMVARLPGGTPPEFRRKLWLALADRHLHTSGIDWNKEQAKCLSSETWLDDDEELGAQIVKDLHRTGSSLFSGPNGNINQAKLKRVLLGYARWNPEVGYCQVKKNISAYFNIHSIFHVISINNRSDFICQKLIFTLYALYW